MLSHHVEFRHADQGAEANFVHQEVAQAWDTLRSAERAEVQASQQSGHAAAAAYQEKLVAVMPKEQATMQDIARAR